MCLFAYYSLFVCSADHRLINADNQRLGFDRGPLAHRFGHLERHGRTDGGRERERERAMQNVPDLSVVAG